MAKRLSKEAFREQFREASDQLGEKIGKGQISFPEWLPVVSPKWTWNWPHQAYLYEKLQLITDGLSKRLMIFLPPRHSKSETCTVRYSAYRLKLNPRLNIILGSYNQKLANRFSRKIKRLAEGRLRMASDSKAVDEWETKEGGGLRAVGVGAGVTGFGAGLIVIDDPIKNRAEAESEVYREKVWEWFNDDLYTRLEPDAAIILTLTRWHEDDLAGRLIKEMEEGGEKWDIARLPALAEENDPLGRLPGEALCPARYDEEALLRIKKKQSSYAFAALYQQRPVMRDGAIFKLDWFRDRIIEKAPSGLNWARGYDLAVSTKNSADYTASFRVAFDKEGNMYIADGYRARIEYPEQRRQVIKRMVAEPDTKHGIEKALHGQAFVQDLRRVHSVRHVALQAVRVDGDKLTRALAWAHKAEEGKVYLIRGAWNEEFLNEITSFPKGRHDDQVDAVSLAVKMLAKRGGKLHGF